MGLYGSPPTMAATVACMEIPELMKQLVPDENIVNEDRSINIQKCSIDYAWNMPKLAKKIGFDESLIREKLADYTQNKEVLDRTKNAYLPPLGGCTVYFFGDITKLGNVCVYA